MHAAHQHGSICLFISLQRINADRLTVKFTRNRYEKALFSVCITYSTVSLPVWLQTDRLMSCMQISSDCDQISHMDLGEALLCIKFILVRPMQELQTLTQTTALWVTCDSTCEVWIYASHILIDAQIVIHSKGTRQQHKLYQRAFKRKSLEANYRMLSNI